MTIEEQDDHRFDPFDPSTSRSSWDKLARLRRECPVSRPSEHFLYTAKLEDTRDVFRDGARFHYGDSGMRKPGAVIPYEERFLGEIDPPEHPGIRKVLRKYFTPAAARAAEPFTRRYVRDRFEQLAVAGGGELLADFSADTPIAVTAHVIGLSTDDVAKIARDMLDVQRSEGFQEGTVGVEDAFPALSRFVDAAIEERSATDDPPDDAVTALLQCDGGLGGSPMTRRQVRTLAVNLLAGSSSTSALLDNLFYRLLSDEAFDRDLRGDRELLPRAVEESLRLEPPVMFLFREARADTELSGRPIHAGERICMGMASANRDEEAYTDAAVFRLDREGEPEHVSFGWGPHLCLGIHLSRMVARVAMEELFDLFPPGGLALAEGYELTFPEDDYLRYGPARLPVVVRATSR
jgi:cytochrome P450